MSPCNYVYILGVVLCFSLSLGVAYPSSTEPVRRCYEHVKKKWNPDRPTDCEPDTRVISEKCFKCDVGCKSLEDIKAARRDNRFECDRSVPPVKINCCLLAQMMNKKNDSISSKYECYKGIEDPQLDCPLGTTGSRCQETLTEPVDCKCYHRSGITDYLDRVNCHDEIELVQWTECHTTLTENGVHLDCLCNKTSKLEISNLSDCSTVPSIAEIIVDNKDGSNGQISYNVYSVTLVVFLSSVFQRFL